MFILGNDFEPSTSPTSTQATLGWWQLRSAITPLLLLVVTLVSLAFFAPMAFAATRTVTDCSSTSDNAGGGTGTLAYALTHYSSGDVISFQCSGDIIIPSTININSNLTFDATGYSVSLDGNNSVEVFSIATSANLTLNNLTITKGAAPAKNYQNYYSVGGGIYNNGTLTINKVSFTSNSATDYGAAIFNVNGATISSIANATFSSNSAGSFGGAIANYGTISSITNSTFNSNTANLGGGILNVASIGSISNCTFYKNFGPSEGEAIDNESGGSISTISNSTFNANSGNSSALSNYDTNTAVSNSTFTANTGYAITNFTGSMVLNHITFYSDSSGAILNYATITAKNNLFVKGSGGNNCNKPMGTFTDSGYNLSDDASCNFAGTGSQNSATLNVGSLQNNGGPTLTIAPLAGNPAIAKIPAASCLTTDQRGYPRPANSNNCDVGAVEVTQLGNNTSTTCQESNLSAALKTGGYILVDCPANTTIAVTTPPDSSSNYRSINISTTLDASPSVGFTLSGANVYQVFNVLSGYNFTINNLTVTKGKASQGAGISNAGTLSVLNSTFSSNSAVSSGSGQGGAIYNSNVINSISNSTFSANSAASTVSYNSSFGGAVYNAGNINGLINSTFASNSANTNGQGGAIYGNGGTILITATTFSGNSANSGGAIYNAGSTIKSKNGLFAKGASGGNCSGIITDSGYNFTDDNSCNFSVANHSQTFTNLYLGSLQNNGGATQTIMPQTGSPAIDAIPSTNPNCTAVTTDQRGYLRPVGGGCDVGAVEIQASPEYMAFSSGSNQSAQEQNLYAQPLIVTVTNGSNGNLPVSGVVITFTAPNIMDSSSPTIVFANNYSTTITATTDINGVASSGQFYANSSVGTVQATATVDFTTLNPHFVRPRNISGPVTFNLTNTTNPNAVDKIRVNNSNLSFAASNSAIAAQNLRLAATSLTNWTSSISYGVEANNWLLLDKTNGVLAPFATQNIAVSVNNEAIKALANGTYTATITFTGNGNPNNKATVNVSLRVGNTPAYTYYLPFVGNNVNGYTSYLAVQNVGNATANFSLNFYDTSGALLTAPLLQGSCANLAAHAECMPANPFNNSQTGTGVISSNQPLNVLVSEATPFGGSAYIVPSGSSNSLVAPIVLKKAYGDFNTRLAIFNGGESATSVTVTFYDQNSNILPSATQTQNVAANTVWTLDQADANLPENFNGWATISAPTGSQLVAQVLEQSQSRKFVAIVNAQPISEAASTLYAPAIFKGAFGFVTGANIVNPNANPVQISITYYDDSGKAYTTPTFVLKANGLTSIYQGDDTILPSGFSGAAVVKSSGGSVMMVVNESGDASSNGTALAGVYTAASNGSNTIGLPIVANGGDGYTTGATILNTSSNGVSGTVQYYNTDGTPQGKAQPFIIGPYGSRLIYQGDAAQNLPSGSDGFYGTAIITENGNGNDLIVTTNAASNLFFTYTEPSS